MAQRYLRVDILQFGRFRRFLVCFGEYDNGGSYEYRVSGYGWYLAPIGESGSDLQGFEEIARWTDDDDYAAEIIGNSLEHPHLLPPTAIGVSPDRDRIAPDNVAGDR